MRRFPADLVLSRQELRDLGCSPGTIRRALHDGRLIRLREGFYSGSGSGACVVAQAATRACAGSTISHRSAGLVHELPLLGSAQRQPEITVDPANSTNVKGAHVYRATLRPQDVMERGGYPVTTVARTLVDLARHSSTRTGVVAADAALNRRLVTAEQIGGVLRFCTNWPGTARARRTFALVDCEAESPLESISRLAFAELELPLPQSQVRIGDSRRRFVGRVDFGWDWLGVVGEADGMLKYDDKDALSAEKRRQERLEQLGLVVVRWGWSDVTRTPELLRKRILAGFDKAARLKQSGSPLTWTVLPDETDPLRAKPQVVTAETARGGRLRAFP